MKKYELNRALSIRKYQNKNQIVLGQTSQKSYAIEFSNELEKYLQFSQEPFSISESILFLIELGMCEEDASEFTKDLISKNILIETNSADYRYDRHNLYFSFENKICQNYESILKSKKIMVLGCGGIGSNCAQMLAASGIGSLVLVDPDIIEISNLPRTLLFNEEHLGHYKVEIAKEQILKKQSDIKIFTCKESLQNTNIAKFAHQYFDTNFIILSGDSPNIHESAELLSKKIKAPIINAGYVDMLGVVGPIIEPDTRSFFGRENALYNFEFGKELNSKLQAPSYGPLNFLVSSITVNEILRYLLGYKIETKSRRIVINSFNYCIEKQECLTQINQVKQSYDSL